MPITRNPIRRLRHLLRGGRLFRRALPNMLRDIRYGAYLGGSIPSPFRMEGMHATESTDWKDLASMFGRPSARPRPGDVIVDIGCGKGRTLAFFHELTRGEARVVGIEINADVGVATRTRFRGVGRIEVLVGDALDLLPHDATLIYMSNPFDPSLVRRFVSVLHERATRLTEIRVVCLHFSGMSVLPFLQRGWTAEPIPRTVVPSRSVILHPPGAG